MDTNVIPMHAASGAQDDLRAQIRVLLDTEAYTQARAAKEISVSATTLSQWLSGSYAGDNDGVAAKVGLWLEQLRERAAQNALPVAPDYVETPTSTRIVSALRYAHVAADIALIYGGAGLGKTATIRHYARTAPNVWHATMKPSTASVVTSLEVIAAAVGAGSASGGAAKINAAICKRIQGSAGLLVVDEAQHLSVQALDELRSIHDATGIGIAIVGNESVYSNMTGGGTRAASLDRLYSRIGKRLRLHRSAAGDVDALIDAWGIDDAKCKPVMHSIASKPGALRGLTKVLRLAAMQAAAAQRPICCTDIKAAANELGGAE